MKSYFKSNFFVNNRRTLYSRLGQNIPLVITANGLMQRNSDNPFKFFQDSNFWYLTGISEPDIVLVIDKNEEYLIVPSRDATRMAFDGTISDKKLSKVSGINDIYSETKGWEKLSQRLSKASEVLTIMPPPAYIQQFGMYTNPARQKLVKRIIDQHPDIKVTDTSYYLRVMRMIKQPQEISALKRAINITCETINELRQEINLGSFQSERQIEAELIKSFLYKGADGHAFSPIVATGKNACTLHNIDNSGLLKPSSLIILDVGAEVEHYAADITRTINYTQPTKRQIEVHLAVEVIQDYAFSILKPGILIKEYEQQIEQQMGQALIQLGLISIKQNNPKFIRKYYPHSTSHFLGLDVHDVGDYNQELTPGVVMTVEPGIYIAKESIGVRIEDDILITNNGNQNMSQKLSRNLNLQHGTI